MSVNGRWLAGLTSQLISAADAATLAVTIRPGHFAQASSFNAIKVITTPPGDPIRPTHFANPHVFSAIRVTMNDGAPDDEDEDMTPRRFWRLQMLKQASNGFALDTLELRTVVSGTQAAVGGTPIESGHFGSEVPANAFDSSTTKWAAGALAGYEYLGYDFGAGNEVDIVEVAIKSYTSEQAQTPYIFLVQKGDDGVNWKDSWMGETTPDWGAAETRVFTRPA